MDMLSSFIIIAVAALIHASFQLSVSVLTLLSGHTIGKKRSQARLVTLMSSFTFGTLVMSILLLSFAGFLFTPLVLSGSASLVWVICCSFLIGLGIAVWLFYYRKQAGTALWVPREFAKYLTERTKKTSHSAEAFGLGISSTLGELLFTFAPIFVAALALIELPSEWQLVGVLLYGFISSLSLLLVNLLVGSGQSLSHIQKWREANKHFLQFAAGSALVILGFYVYVDQVVAVAATGGM